MKPKVPFKRVFIANRGEICRRIAVTARSLGLETVCLTDRAVPSKFLLGLITHFVKVEAENPSLYLDLNAMVRFAVENDCDCLHPGFGFLSENAAFAVAVEKAGLTWIGPPSSSIEAMADKSAARMLADKLGVPCTKGLNNIKLGDAQGPSQQDIEAFATKTGFPLLIKAALGGGGKGMRLVYKTEELGDALQKASSEARNAFGDPSLLIEQYIERSRHIEVQILADKHGQVFAIGDRDCSLQRRHQKIIEEAPAPSLHPKTRENLHACAVRLAKEVNYVSAGTVEFLLDWSPAAKSREKQSFYFLEMNTRLQVEHPVTEEIFGLDLVAWQFYVAAGIPLPAGFGHLQAQGHSVEARFYGEDPEKNFFPAPGLVHHFEPYHSLGIRWEIGLDTQDEISSRFDPMIAKVIAHAETREMALRRLGDALAKTFFCGPATNREFLVELLGSRFRDEVCSTHFIGEELPNLLAATQRDKGQQQVEAQKALDWLAQTDLGHTLTQQGQQAPTATGLTKLAFQSSSVSPQTAPKAEGSPFQVLSLNVRPSVGTSLFPSIAGCALHRTATTTESFPFLVLREEKRTIFSVLWKGYEYTFIKDKRRWLGEHDSQQHKGDMIAPVPGKIVKIKVRSGDQVKKGDSVFVLESMKMEFDVQSVATGFISKVLVEEQRQVSAGDLLAIIETAGG